MQFISPWLLRYFLIGTLMGIPLALAFQKSIQEEGTREPRSLLEKVFFDFIRHQSSIERLQMEIFQDRYVFAYVILVAVFWFPLLCLLIFDIVKIEIKNRSVIKYRILFLYRTKQFRASSKKFACSPTTENARKLEKRIRQLKNAIKLYEEALQKILDTIQR